MPGYKNASENNSFNKVKGGSKKSVKKHSKGKHSKGKHSKGKNTLGKKNKMKKGGFIRARTPQNLMDKLTKM